MVSTPHDTKQDLAAALGARREMGPEYDAAFAESVVTRLEQMIDQRLGPQRPPMPPPQAFPPGMYPHQHRRPGMAVQLVTAILSLVFSIPLTAIVANHGDTRAILIPWIGLVAINLAVAWGVRRSSS